MTGIGGSFGFGTNPETGALEFRLGACLGIGFELRCSFGACACVKKPTAPKPATPKLTSVDVSFADKMAYDAASSADSDVEV